MALVVFLRGANAGGRRTFRPGGLATTRNRDTIGAICRIIEEG